MRSVHGLSGAPVPAGDDLDFAAAFAGEGQELFDRQRIRDPFGEPLGARGLIFEILDRDQAPPSPNARDLEHPIWLVKHGAARTANGR